MNTQERNEIVGAAADALMERLAADGTVSAVVVVVLVKDDESVVAANVEAESAEEAERLMGPALLSASDLIDEYVHDNELCDECAKQKGTIQ